MIELKPRCDGCGTGNALDAIFCQECGVGLNIENDECTHNADCEIHFGTRGNIHNTITEYPKIKEECTHQKIERNYQCDCARCIDCDTRTETCQEHIPKFDYGLQTKKKDSLDHLRETLSPKTPFPEDKRLDFRSNQIPDWEFKEDIRMRDEWPMPMGGIIKVPDASPRQLQEIAETFDSEMEKVKKDPNYIPLMVTNKDIEIVPFSPITRTDVYKGIPSHARDVDGRFVIPKIPKQKPEPTQINMIGADSTMKIHNGFSRIEKTILKFCTIAIIISLGILYFV